MNDKPDNRRRIIIPVESGLMLSHLDSMRDSIQEALPDFRVIVISGMSGSATVIDK